MYKFASNDFDDFIVIDTVRQKEHHNKATTENTNKTNDKNENSSWFWYLTKLHNNYVHLKEIHRTFFHFDVDTALILNPYMDSNIGKLNKKKNAQTNNNKGRKWNYQQMKPLNMVQQFATLTVNVIDELNAENINNRKRLILTWQIIGKMQTDAHKNQKSIFDLFTSMWWRNNSINFGIL